MNKLNKKTIIPMSKTVIPSNIYIVTMDTREFDNHKIIACYQYE